MNDSLRFPKASLIMHILNRNHVVLTVGTQLKRTPGNVMQTGVPAQYVHGGLVRTKSRRFKLLQDYITGEILWIL